MARSTTAQGHAPGDHPLSGRQHGRLFRKYVLLIVLLVSGALVVSGLVELYFSYRENETALARLQQEKAQGAASTIRDFLGDQERALGWAAGAPSPTQRRDDFTRLLRLAPAITDVSFLDTAGHEQLRVSRLAMNVVGSGTDYSTDPRFTEPKANRAYFGPVYFRNESEPYMTISRRDDPNGVISAEVNLKLIWDVVTQIRVGAAGYAYVVDESGQLVAHPDISLVLRKTDLSGFSHVQEARATPRRVLGATDQPTITRDFQGRQMLTAFALVEPPGWFVFVDQPLDEALSGLYASIARTVVLVLLGIALSIIASLALARRMVTPIRALQASAAQIGAGALDQRIDIRTGDELETLAEEFNRMTAQLRESYATLERRVEERTHELRESLDQQTATSEILRVIASSPNQLEPVLEAVAESAARLCDAADAVIFRVEGDLLKQAAAYGSMPTAARLAGLPLTRGSVNGRAVIERRTIHVHDLAAEPESEFPEGRALREHIGNRTTLATPLLREGVPLGTIMIRRLEVRPFTDQQIDLLRTFADQAVIAIENVRLFQELEARSREIGEALRQQTAIAEVLRTIASSPTDLASVLESVADNAAALCDADDALIHRVEGDSLNAVVYGRLKPVWLPDGADPSVPGTLGNFPVSTSVPIERGNVPGRAILERRVVHVEDMAQAVKDEYPGGAVYQKIFGLRSMLAAPLMRQGAPVGTILIRRVTMRPFTDAQMELLRTFADQAAIAIENARLFQELEHKNHELEIASTHKSEFLANMSHELRTPLNAIIGFSEVLAEKMFGDLNERQEEYLNDILTSGQHLLSLINDILDLSKVEAGRMELELDEFSLPQSLENGLTMVKERAARHGIALALKLDPDVDVIEADERKIKQMVFNLLSNAVKFTPDGGSVTLGARNVDRDVHIAVSDTGIGIPENDQELIFEEFRQSNEGHGSGRPEGTGLGLALTRRFAELHGGRIWVQSEVGVGSTFTFAIPRRQSFADGVRDSERQDVVRIERA